MTPAKPSISQLFVLTLLLTAVEITAISVGDSSSSEGDTRWDCIDQCSCHLDGETLSVACLPGGADKAVDNVTMQPVYGITELNTNDTTSTATPPHNTSNLTEILDMALVTTVYIENFQGEDGDILWSFLEKGLCHIKIIYFKGCGFYDALQLSSLENLTHVQIDQAAFVQNSTESLFTAPKQLLSMTIINSNLSIMAENTFTKLQHLKTVNLSGNMMRNLNDTILSNLSSLENFNISRNWLLSSNLACTQPLISLKILDMSFNQLKSVDGLCYTGLPNLEILDLSHNLIEVLEEGSFEGRLSRLGVLDLSSNMITQMNLGCFGCDLSSLHSLSLQDNLLPDLNLQVLAPLQNLHQVNVSHNQIKSVTRQIDNSSNVTHCESQYPVLEPLPHIEPFMPIINLWPHLEIVDMSYNNISVITQKLFDEFFKNARKLHLSHNRINYVPRYGIEHLQRLESIDLSHNMIDWMDVGTFTNLHLRDIDLSHNKLKKVISMTFLYLPNLQRLDLSHNRLNYLYRLSLYKTCKYGQAMQLNLMHNKLSEDAIWKFMSTFREMKSDNCVLQLRFQNNRMKYLLDPPSRQTFVRNLHEKRPEFFHMWTHSHFNMSYNKFQCDCHLHQDIALIRRINQAVVTHTNSNKGLFRWQYMICEKPNNLKGMNLKMAELELDQICTANKVNGQGQYRNKCGHPGSISSQEMDGTPCGKTPINKTNFMTATIVATIGTAVGIVAVICILKKAGVLPRITNRAKWYKVYLDENNIAQSIGIYYHSSDKSLVTNELVYFVQDCCPSHDVLLCPTNNINDQIAQPQFNLPKTSLFIVSKDLMREIRGSSEVQNHYEEVIEQSQVAVFLVMGIRGDMELLYPTFWSKIKYKHNVYFVCGTDRLPKLQCVLTNTVIDNTAQTY